MKPASKKGQVILLALLSLLASGPSRMGGQTTDEHRVEATFLFHFAQLVDWPPDARSSTDTAMFLCTLGSDPFQGALENTIAGKPVGTRTIQIRHLEGAEDLKSCQILFIGRAEASHLTTLVTILHHAPVLTVGESSDFLDAGGMIRFVVGDNKVRFDINVAAAQSAGLKVRSRLLVLAQQLVGASHEK
jgi:hypothetical protein